MSDRAFDSGAAWLRLKLVRKVRETAEISSFYFESEDGVPLPGFRAGQYLTLSIQANSKEPVLRTYTLSSSTHELGRYRITVKREGAPADRPDLPSGIGSGFLHDHLSEGDVIPALPPRGRSVLDDSDRPVVLLSGGVGLTPMVAILADLSQAEPRRPVWFIHACRDASHRALHEEVAALAGRHRQAQVLTVFEADTGAARPDAVGLVDMALLQKWLPLDDYSFYLCGPPGFMSALYRGLTGLNIAEDRIAYEHFGPATVLKPATERDAPKVFVASQSAKDGPIVEFGTSGVTATFSNEVPSILDLAKREGLEVLYSCEEGICGTCRCRLIEGEVEYSTEPIAHLDEGEILTCIGRPKTDIKIEL